MRDGTIIDSSLSQSPISKLDIPEVNWVWFKPFELVGLESVMCGTPVLQYTDKKKKMLFDCRDVINFVKSKKSLLMSNASIQRVDNTLKL